MTVTRAIMASSLIQPLFDGPLDIVGDIHGGVAEHEACVERFAIMKLGDGTYG